METKDFTEKRKALIEQLKSAQDAIGRKRESEGYVVAGYGGDTYYSFVGEGRGYEGAALIPVSSSPVIFSSRKAAQREANNGTYRNGRGDIVKLEVVEAADYFKKLYADFQKNIDFITNLN